MPYTVNIPDVSGQVRGQGMQSAVQSIMDGFKQYQQNKLMAGQAIARFEGATKANPDILEFINSPDAPQEASRAYNKLKSSGTLGLKDAAVLAQFSDTYTQEKKSEQDRNLRELQMRKAEMDLQAVQAEQSALDRLNQIGQFMSPQMQPTGPVSAGAGPQAITTTSMGGPASLGNFMQASRTGGGVLSPAQQQATLMQLASNPDLMEAARLASATGKLPTPNDLLQARQLKMQAVGGGAPTTAMRDTDAIIASELQAGVLPPARVAARRAELLAAGGRNPSSRFDNAGTFVNAQTGGDARAAVKDQKTGQIGWVNQNGEFEPMDPKQWKPSTVGDVNALLDPPQFEKLREKVMTDERTIRQLDRYLSGFENLSQGTQQLADRISKNVKTLFTKEKLTDEELALGIQEGRMQAILGGLRTAIVGPGVMTEQDAERVIAAVGGNISALTNPENVRALVGEVLTDKIREYEEDLEVYNTHVVRKYGGQGGYKQRQLIPVNYKKPEKAVAEEEAGRFEESKTPPSAPARWTPEKQKRLEELRANLRK